MVFGQIRLDIRHLPGHFPDFVAGAEDEITTSFDLAEERVTLGVVAEPSGLDMGGLLSSGPLLQRQFIEIGIVNRVIRPDRA